MFAYQTKELRILKQLLYKLVYEKELILAIDYRLYRGLIIKRLLKITNKVSQLRELA